MRVLLHSLALEDIRLIIGILDEDSIQAAGHFRAELHDAVRFLSEHPGSGHPAGPFRRWNLKRFPYHLLYLERPEAGELWVMVIRHHSRHPRHGMHRRPPVSDS